MGIYTFIIYKGSKVSKKNATKKTHQKKPHVEATDNLNPKPIWEWANNSNPQAKFRSCAYDMLLMMISSLYYTRICSFSFVY